jgi:hypothetical protein
MDIKRSGSRASQKGPAEWFTGTVRVDPLFQAQEPVALAEATSPSSPARAPTGIRIRSDKF